MSDKSMVKSRIERVRALAHKKSEMFELYEAAALAQSVLHDTLGAGHPIMRMLEEGVKTNAWQTILGACGSVVRLYDEGMLRSPTLRIAHEIEGGILDIADTQVKLAEMGKTAEAKLVGLAISAFLAGAALEDALRRLCENNAIVYDVQHSTIARLQASLYQPAKGIEVISASETKQITSWGDTRNKADHGKFSEITQTEVIMMTMGVRAFIDKHLP